jgi:hypothetical protein
MLWMQEVTTGMREMKYLVNCLKLNIYWVYNVINCEVKNLATDADSVIATVSTSITLEEAM